MYLQSIHRRYEDVGGQLGVGSADERAPGEPGHQRAAHELHRGAAQLTASTRARHTAALLVHKAMCLYSPADFDPLFI